MNLAISSCDRKLACGTKLQHRALAALLLVGCVALPLRAAAQDASRYDGDWGATLSCPKSADGAMAFSFEFAAQVKGGVLHGERGTAGEPGWMSLDGAIHADGSAALVAEGLTNLSQYAITHARKGTPYRHDVSAQFSETHGTGSWEALRTCTFTFDKTGGAR